MKATSVKSVAMFSDGFFFVLSHTFAVLRPLFPVKPEPPFANTDRKQ
jgi:hypothetical protein